MKYSTYTYLLFLLVITFNGCSSLQNNLTVSNKVLDFEYQEEYGLVRILLGKVYVQNINSSPFWIARWSHTSQRTVQRVEYFFYEGSVSLLKETKIIEFYKVGEFYGDGERVYLNYNLSDSLIIEETPSVTCMNYRGSCNTKYVSKYQIDNIFDPHYSNNINIDYFNYMMSVSFIEPKKLLFSVRDEYEHKGFTLDYILKKDSTIFSLTIYKDSLNNWGQSKIK